MALICARSITLVVNKGTSHILATYLYTYFSDVYTIRALHLVITVAVSKDLCQLMKAIELVKTSTSATLTMVAVLINASTTLEVRDIILCGTNPVAKRPYVALL